MSDGRDEGGDTRADLAERRGLNTAYYEAAEDSALLASAATEVVRPDWLVLEVGVGSGYVAERVAGATGATLVGSDVNPHACRSASERGTETVRADLVAPFAGETFDAVLFNPPYLPTPEEVEWDDWTERALSGGDSGRAVIDPFLDSVGRVLAPDGVVLLLVSSLTDVDAVVARAESAGLTAETVAEEAYPYERLVVLALRHN